MVNLNAANQAVRIIDDLLQSGEDSKTVVLKISQVIMEVKNYNYYKTTEKLQYLS